MKREGVTNRVVSFCDSCPISHIGKVISFANESSLSFWTSGISHRGPSSDTVTQEHDQRRRELAENYKRDMDRLEQEASLTC